MTKVSLEPPKPAEARRLQRVLRMVHELHKVGYQGLRVWPVLDKDSTGVAIATARSRLTGNPELALYRSKMGHRYFDWSDAAECDARRLAQKFIERFPELCVAGRGLDLPYAGWFVSMLGWTESGVGPFVRPDGQWPFPEPHSDGVVNVDKWLQRVEPVPLDRVPTNLEDRRLEQIFAALEMVQVLHSYGYQRLRVFTHDHNLGPRLFIASSDRFCSNGYRIDGELSGDHVVGWQFEMDDRFFEGDDGEVADPQLLATRFARKFPGILASASGVDYEYAGWFSIMVGRARLGEFIPLDTDYDHERAIVHPPVSGLTRVTTA